MAASPAPAHIIQAETRLRSENVNAGNQPSQQMIADELHKLFDLLQKGAITQEEYVAQKNKLMGA